MRPTLSDYPTSTAIPPPNSWPVYTDKVLEEATISDLVEVVSRAVTHPTVDFMRDTNMVCGYMRANPRRFSLVSHANYQTVARLLMSN